MKISKNSIFLGAIILVSLCSCNKQKEIRAIGFGYKGDNISLSTEENKFLSFIVNGREDTNRLCFFNRKMKLLFEKKDIKLTIAIDSNNIRVLDTLITISQHNKEPFISFIYPSIEAKYKRSIFIGDEADSSFIKE